MKKRVSIVLLCSFIFLSCSQESNLEGPMFTDEITTNYVNLEDALQIANSSAAKNLGGIYKTRATGKSVKSIRAIYDFSERIASFYIVNYQSGFSIISADKRDFPILAHSDNATFPDVEESQLPEGLADWFFEQKERISKIRKNNIPLTDDQFSIWTKYYYDEMQFKDTSKNKGLVTRYGEIGDEDNDSDPCEARIETYGPYLTTNWDQINGFNDLMPLLPNGDHAYAGCTTIALAQVMKFHEYPSRFNWSDMPNSTATLTTKQFVKDIFDNIITHYDLNGSHSNINACRNSLINDYGYSSAVKSDYDYNILRQALYTPNVVILAGDNPTTGKGHMWICDGYEYAYYPCPGVGYRMYHMNWGWGGACDGYFRDGQFSPAGESFNSHREMIHNIRK